MKPCTDKKEAIAMLATGGLAASEAAALRGHLQECAGCSSYASQLASICSRLGEPAAGLASLEPPPGFHARLKHRMQSEQQTSARASFIDSLRALFTLSRITSAAAIITLAVALALWMRSDKGSVDQRALRTVQASPSGANDKATDLSGSSTLMAYQAAFNRSFEDFEALVTQNAARTTTDDGMTLKCGATASF